jgi:hypothetical protein
MSKFFIGAMVDGFPVLWMYEGELEGLVHQVTRLSKYDIRPLPLSALAAMSPASSPIPAMAAPPSQTAPLCRYHGPMRASVKKPGTWFCPKKLHDGTHCPEAA